jgi:hypothetical protein
MAGAARSAGRKGISSAGEAAPSLLPLREKVACAARRRPDEGASRPSACGEVEPYPEPPLTPPLSRERRGRPAADVPALSRDPFGSALQKEPRRAERPRRLRSRRIGPGSGPGHARSAWPRAPPCPAAAGRVDLAARPRPGGDLGRGARSGRAPSCAIPTRPGCARPPSPLKGEGETRLPVRRPCSAAATSGPLWSNSETSVEGAGRRATTCRQSSAIRSPGAPRAAFFRPAASPALRNGTLARGHAPDRTGPALKATLHSRGPVIMQGGRLSRRRTERDVSVSISAPAPAAGAPGPRAPGLAGAGAAPPPHGRPVRTRLPDGEGWHEGNMDKSGCQGIISLNVDRSTYSKLLKMKNAHKMS